MSNKKPRIIRGFLSIVYILFAIFSINYKSNLIPCANGRLVV